MKPWLYHVALSNYFQQRAAFRAAAEQMEREGKSRKSSHTLYLERGFELKWPKGNHITKMELSGSRHNREASPVITRRKGRREENGAAPPWWFSPTHTAEAAGSHTGLSRTVTSPVHSPDNKKLLQVPKRFQKDPLQGDLLTEELFQHLPNPCQAERHTRVLLSEDNHIPGALPSTKCSCSSDPLGAVTSSFTVLPPALELPLVLLGNCLHLYISVNYWAVSEAPEGIISPIQKE